MHSFFLNFRREILRFPRSTIAKRKNSPREFSICVYKNAQYIFNMCCRLVSILYVSRLVLSYSVKGGLTNATDFNPVVIFQPCTTWHGICVDGRNAYPLGKNCLGERERLGGGGWVNEGSVPPCWGLGRTSRKTKLIKGL
jgi:hypothetical protein